MQGQKTEKIEMKKLGKGKTTRQTKTRNGKDRGGRQ